jgi:hypothetical protein
LLTELGLQPDLAESRLSPGTKQLMKTLAEGNWPMITRLRPSEPQVVEISQFLHGFLIFHLGKIPKGRNAAVGLGLR